MSRTPTAASVTSHLARVAFSDLDLDTKLRAVQLGHALRHDPTDARLIATACGFLFTLEQARRAA